MATRDLYINLKADSLTGAFIVSHKSGAAYKLPPFYRQEKVDLRLFFVTPNATGGFASPFTIEDVSTYTLRVAIGSSGVVLAGPGSWSWDSGNLCWTGALDLYTEEMEDALAGAGAAGLTGKTFEVEIVKTGKRFLAQQTVAVRQCVLDDMAGAPTPVDPGTLDAMLISLGVAHLPAVRLLPNGNTVATVSDLGCVIFTDAGGADSWVQLQLPPLADAIAHKGTIRVLAGRTWTSSDYIAVYPHSGEASPNRFIYGNGSDLYSLYSTGKCDYLELIPITISGTNYWQVITSIGLWQDRD
ncbi:MAG: hypothetical protein EBS05_10120 [Proteobacteria bacterium]|nr:hypothetical protein [Pseudomonadota bacterium]NDA69261.1 hypothetical protein [Verrucomicrobiota bacterium]NDD38442.1 hypothetical protein [Verrucomicrobiota bacterium]NDF01675.1 hypothetical protein [Verrucomicrobiota bacterium]